MNMYLWTYIDRAKANYHTGSGLVVIAESEEEARRIAKETRGVQLDPDEPVTCSYPVEANIATVWLFPDMEGH